MRGFEFVCPVRGRGFIQRKLGRDASYGCSVGVKFTASSETRYALLELRQSRVKDRQPGDPWI